MSDENSKPKRSFVSFSLQKLLCLVAVIAVAAWWIRRPKIEVFQKSQDTYYDKVVGPSATWGLWNPAYSETKHEQTLRRTDFFHYVQDGETRVYDSHGNVIQVQQWKEDEQVSCQYFFRDAHGRIVTEGKTVRGRPHGVWRWWAANKFNPRPQDWYVRNGKCLLIACTPIADDDYFVRFASNDWKQHTAPWRTLKRNEGLREAIQARANAKIEEEPAHEFVFDHGDLVSVDGVAADDFLWRIPRTGDTKVFRQLLESIKIPNMTHMGTYHEMLMTLLPQRNYQIIDVPKDQAVFCSIQGAPLPLVATMHLMLARYGLCLDYRHGFITIVNTANARQWKDRTGVQGLFTGNADLTQSLDSQVSLSVFESPTTSLKLRPPPLQRIPIVVQGESAIGALAKRLVGQVNWRSRETKIGVTFVGSDQEIQKTFWPMLGSRNQALLNERRSPSDVKLRDALGLFLEEHGLVCEDQGRSLIIREQSSSK